MDFSGYEKKYDLTKFKFVEITRESETALEASEKLNLPYKVYIRIAKILGIYKPNQGRKGRKGSAERGGLVTLTPLEEILQGLHPNYVTNRLKHRMVEAGIIEWKCSKCGIVEWQGEHIALELDHINGNNSDHRLENLRILCPNCHSQTPTFGNKKRERLFDPFENKETEITYNVTLIEE